MPFAVSAYTKVHAPYRCRARPGSQSLFPKSALAARDFVSVQEGAGMTMGASGYKMEGGEEGRTEAEKWQENGSKKEHYEERKKKRKEKQQIRRENPMYHRPGQATRKKENK